MLTVIISDSVDRDDQAVFSWSGLVVEYGGFTITTGLDSPMVSLLSKAVKKFLFAHGNKERDQTIESRAGPKH